MLNVLATWLEHERQWPQWASASCLALLLVLVAMHVLDRALLSKKCHPSASGSSSSTVKEHKSDAAFQSFRRQYLTVYFLVMFADWLQGTHMYSLYQSYGVNVSALFLTGFLSSAIFGNFIGPIVDRYGRRNACLVYCALEIVINLLENVPDITVLLIGRVLGGVSTSLLFSAFESWMVTEHRARGFAEELIPKTFAIASEGNGVLAVLAGFAAQAAADAFGEIGPFRLAVGVTTFAAAFVCSWAENYGSPEANSAPASASKPNSTSNSGSRLSAEAVALGLCYSLFDGAIVLVVPDAGSRGALGDPSERAGLLELHALHRDWWQALRPNRQQNARRASRLCAVRRLRRSAARSDRHELLPVDPRRILRVRGEGYREQQLGKKLQC